MGQRTDLESKGVEFVTEIAISQSEKATWTYFVGPDGFLHEIWQRRLKTGTT